VSRFEWTGRFTLTHPPQRAFVAFTARGEIGWASDWNPVFHGPADDDSAPGTVFVTAFPEETIIWQVMDRRPGEYVRYSRVTPGVAAGTVTVVLEPVALPSGGTGSAVEVTFALTALSEAGKIDLQGRATDPQRSPSAWREPVEAYLATLPAS
jgi:hypothetical protein